MGSSLPQMHKSSASCHCSCNEVPDVVSGVFAALIVMHALAGSMATKVIAKIQYFYVFLNLA